MGWRLLGRCLYYALGFALGAVIVATFFLLGAALVGAVIGY